MKVHRSALKHGISTEDAIQAAEWPLWIEPLDEDGPPHRELRLGFDTSARLLETVYWFSTAAKRLSSTRCLLADNISISCPERVETASVSAITEPSIGAFDLALRQRADRTVYRH